MIIHIQVVLDEDQIPSLWRQHKSDGQPTDLLQIHLEAAVEAAMYEVSAGVCLSSPEMDYEVSSTIEK